MKSSRYFKLGLFILIGVGLLFGAGVALGTGRLLEKHILAQTSFDESVDGLEVGAPVKYRGVNIGRVTSIAFTAEKGDHIEPHQIAPYVVVDISIDAKSFKGINLDQVQATLKNMTEEGLRARITTQGIGGGVYIGLDFAQGAAKPALPHSESAAVLYIPSAPSTMNQVMSAAEQLARDLRQANLPRVVEHIDGLVTSAGRTSEGLHTLLSSRQEDIGRIIADLRRTADNLAVISTDARENPSRLFLSAPPARKPPGQ